MKPVLLNGKDASIDYDFFVGLGADRNNIIFTPDMPKGLHEVGFRQMVRQTECPPNHL